MVAVFVLVLVNHCEHSTITWIKERDDEANLHAPGPASQPQRRKMAQHISWLFRSWTDMDSFRLGVGQNYVDVVSHCRFQADDFLPNICMMPICSAKERYAVRNRMALKIILQISSLAFFGSVLSTCLAI